MALGFSTGSDGIVHVQTSEPTYVEGETWLNPDTGIYYAAFDGKNGKGWYPIPVVRNVDEATIFDGSDGESVNTSNGVDAGGGNISLGSATGSTVSRPDDNQSDDAPVGGFWAGIGFNPNKEMTSIQFTVSSNTSNAPDFELWDSSYNTLDSGVSGSAGNTLTLSASMSSGNKYYLVGSTTNSETYGWYDSPNYPYTNTVLDITTGYYDDDNSTRGAGDTSTEAYLVNDLVPDYKASSGNALIYWGSPDDIESWDLATFQRTLDNESVTVDIEDSNGNVLYSDIGKDFDISSVSSSKSIRIRANLSRNSFSNNPTLDYAARRYTR